MPTSRLKRLSILVAALAVLAAYLLLWPVPVEPVAWRAPPAPGYVGPHAVNTRLANLRTIDIGKEVGPEHLAFGPDGKLYAAMASGAIVRMNADRTGQETFANTGGRVLGFDFDAQGRLVAADAIKGLLAIAPDRKLTVLAEQVRPGDPISFANGIALSPMAAACSSTRRASTACGRSPRRPPSWRCASLRRRPRCCWTTCPATRTT